ncbi:hypothetical protein [Spirulina sp. 06S082]|uniref:hypothetical protein n=1 Tax=Spirulina sp. 06S082 TaxID=3110248 RepID=UPI002B1F3BBE|nr:hypothetical protein [Spirulina sp. 06S082]MEA5469193.1 hypothetical protein [Spirulina sp. 06S082]
MTPNLLRQLWFLVENTQAPVILGRDDASLVEWLLDQLARQRSLEGYETEVISDYIRSKTSLIRDLAAQR